MNDLNNFPRLLKEFREKYGLTQSELASKVKYSLSHIEKLESGIRKPSWRFLEAMGKSWEKEES